MKIRRSFIVVIVLFSICNTTLFAQSMFTDTLSYQYLYGKEIKQIIDLRKQLSNTEDNKASLYLEMGKLYRLINKEDSAYASYYKAYDLLKDNHTSKLLHETILGLHTIESSKDKYKYDRRFFLNQYHKYALENDTDEMLGDYWKELASDYLQDSADYAKARYYYMKAATTSRYLNDVEFQAKIYHNLAYISSLQKKFQESDSLYTIALERYKKANSTKGEFYIHLNKAILYKERKDFKNALLSLKEAEKVPISAYKLKSYRLLFYQYAALYDSLSDNQNKKKYQKEIKKLDSILEDYKRNLDMYVLDTEREMEIKNAKISLLKKKQIILGILIILALLIVGYLFYRWKQSKKKKVALEVEHEQVVNEIKAIKELIIKDHIILKNKAKILLDELIYIKAEDHYLALHTANKKEFVRGKVIDIIQQLPPNFARCHRSYIVNKNYVDSTSRDEVKLQNGVFIPLSRTYKKTFLESNT